MTKVALVLLPVLVLAAAPAATPARAQSPMVLVPATGQTVAPSQDDPGSIAQPAETKASSSATKPAKPKKAKTATAGAALELTPAAESQPVAKITEPTKNSGASKTSGVAKATGAAKSNGATKTPAAKATAPAAGSDPEVEAALAAALKKTTRPADLASQNDAALAAAARAADAAVKAGTTAEAGTTTETGTAAKSGTKAKTASETEAATASTETSASGGAGSASSSAGPQVLYAPASPPPAAEKPRIRRAVVRVPLPPVRPVVEAAAVDGAVDAPPPAGEAADPASTEAAATAPQAAKSESAGQASIDQASVSQASASQASASQASASQAPQRPASEASASRDQIAPPETAKSLANVGADTSVPPASAKSAEATAASEAGTAKEAATASATSPALEASAAQAAFPPDPSAVKALSAAAHTALAAPVPASAAQTAAAPSASASAEENVRQVADLPAPPLPPNAEHAPPRSSAASTASPSTAVATETVATTTSGGTPADAATHESTPAEGSASTSAAHADAVAAGAPSTASASAVPPPSGAARSSSDSAAPVAAPPALAAPLASPPALAAAMAPVAPVAPAAATAGAEPLDTDPFLPPKPAARKAVVPSIGEPYELMRTLQSLQDQMAAGSVAVLSAQHVLLGRMGDSFANADPLVWQDRRNAEALITYVLSGGNPEALRRQLNQRLLPAADVALMQGVLAYVEGRESVAKKLLSKYDPRTLPASMAAQVALARAALAISTDRKEAIAMLDDARLLAPGTLTEEAALRREILVVSEEGDTPKFERLSRQYLQRFRKSVYAGNFRQRFAASLSRMDFVNDPKKFSQLDGILSEVDPTARVELFLLIARASVNQGRTTAARLSAERVLEEVEPGSPFEARALVYRGAALAVTSPHTDLVLDQLQRIDPTMLDPSDRALLKAASETASLIDHASDFSEEAPPPPPKLAPGQKMPEPDKDSTTVANAKTRLAAIDSLLAGAPQ